MPPKKWKPAIDVLFLDASRARRRFNIGNQRRDSDIRNDTGAA
jgi:hypothetical protein